RALGGSLDHFTVASVLCELVMRLAPEHRDDDLFRVLRDGLDALHTRARSTAPGIGLEHVWNLVAALGFRPELEHCMACGEPIGEERARFDYAAGGLVCSRCAPSGPGLDADELRELRALVAGGTSRNGAGRQAGWLADFIRYHLTEGANLRSLEFLKRLG
ncbi:MAG: DNA repair protein RecO C-terminal domain-containing protein, partial [Gemmatimonadetes bacterium]|nr:DNA repair protein RecO C-terminal domain-containing protein [Gemmatimonadota bacterium]